MAHPHLHGHCPTHHAGGGRHAQHISWCPKGQPTWKMLESRSKLTLLTGRESSAFKRKWSVVMGCSYIYASTAH